MMDEAQTGPRIILASQSAIRAQILKDAGVTFEIRASSVDEAAAKAVMRDDMIGLSDQAMTLAELKAKQVSLSTNGIVIGADQMLDLEGRAFDKPLSMQEARERLIELSGKTHCLQTAVAGCLNGEVIWRCLSRPRLTMRHLSPDFIDRYLHLEGTALLSSVGAYRLEKMGVQLFERIEGDYFAILGLPILPLLSWLREIGVVRG